MLVLLPPSEGKSAPRRGNRLDLSRLDLPELTEARARLLDALVTLCRDDPDGAVRTLGLGPSQAAEVAANAALYDARTARADRIYTGVLYDALDVAGLDAASRRRATRWLAITSSVFGLVRLGDPIPAYRLSGSVTLPDVGGVAAYWRERLDPAVRAAAGGGIVVDLRSSTYAGFWRPQPDLARRVATLRVLHEVDGKRQIVSHFNKATKGRLVRDLLVDGGNPSSPARLADHLAALGWKVEQQPPTTTGTALDVVVEEL